MNGSPRRVVFVTASPASSMQLPDTASRLCARRREKEPLDCHRTLLVARALDAAGATVEHILADGALEPHGMAMDRLLAAFDLNPDCDLFRKREELVADAIVLQARRVAYYVSKR